MTSTALLDNLTKDVTEMITRTKDQFIHLDDTTLSTSPGPGSWNMLQCFEHLNRYNRYYNALIEKKLATAPAAMAGEYVRSTWIGRKSLEAMHPGNRKKQKTLKHMNTGDLTAQRSAITEFLTHQEQLLNLLSSARAKSLNKVRIPIEFFRLLSMNLADAFQFVIAHQQRHFLQLDRINVLVAARKKVA